MPDRDESIDAIFAEGILEILPDGQGFLRPVDEALESGAFRPAADDIRVPQTLLTRFHLKQGDRIAGQVRPPEPGEAHFSLVKVDFLNSRSLLA